MDNILRFRGAGICSILVLLVLVSMIATPAVLTAQTRGEIVGKVTNAATGENMLGANVQLQGTSFGAATDRSGNYRISYVPFGTYTIVITYIGYERYTVEVTVSVTQREVTHDAALNVSAVELETVVKYGLREGQMRALSQQRTALTIKNVVAQEQMERFPDVNTAEVLQRVPGVFTQRSQGDGRYVFIRGTAPGLNYVTVNGERLATNRVEERYSQLDIIAASQLASVEVTKAITPDMDGDAIGGAVNLVTRSAFDYPGSRWSLAFGPGYAKIDKKMTGQGKLSYSNRFGADKNFGFTFSANWDRKERGTDGMEFDFDEAEDINDNPIPFALDQFDMRDYHRTRTRYGFGTGLEFRVNDSHQWFVRGMYSRMKDQQWRSRWRIRVSKGDYLNQAGTLTEDSRIIMEATQRLEDLKQIHLSTGGLHKFGNKELDYTFAYSFGNEEHPDQMETNWELDEKVNLQLDLSDMTYPGWEVINLPEGYIYDPAHYEFDGGDYRSTYARNWQYVGAVNFKAPYSLGSLPSELKMGFKLRRDIKDRDEDKWKLKWKGEGDLTLDQYVSDYEDPDFMNEHYEIGPGPDGDALLEWYKENVDGDLKREMDWWSSEAQYYNNFESIYAYYLMTTHNAGNFMFLYGFRHELTRAEYKGTEVKLSEDGDLESLARVTVQRNYNNFLPMAHIRWRVTPMTNVRVAYTRTLARPNYWFVTPYYYIDADGEEIEYGNPELEPTTAHNFDFMLEHYFQGIGVLAGGFFYKKLDDIIFERETKVVGGTFDDFDLTSPVNGGDAKLYGFELTWNQELSFLPGFLNGFGIYTNYTHTWADANLGLGREGFLPGQTGDIANVSLSYDKYGFSTRISAMYQGEFLETVGKNEDWDEWKGSHMQVDISMAYDVLPWMQIYVDCINITNAPMLDYYGIPDRPKERDYYSWWMQSGIKISR